MTAQIMDTLLIDGERVHVANGFGLPEVHPAITKLESVPENVPRIIRSTACWRRYVAHWEVVDGFLYLRFIEGIYFKGSDQPISANWVNGDFLTVQTEVRDGEYTPALPIFKPCLRLRIRNGQLINVEPV